MFVKRIHDNRETVVCDGCGQERDICYAQWIAVCVGDRSDRSQWRTFCTEHCASAHLGFETFSHLADTSRVGVSKHGNYHCWQARMGGRGYLRYGRSGKFTYMKNFRQAVSQ